MNMNDAINILLKGYKQIDINNIPNISGIYLFRNKINNKVYIGQANDIHIRFNQHKNQINDGLYFHRALLKYGYNNFEYYILESFTFIDKDIQNEREIYFINKFKSNNKDYGYNLTAGGEGHLGTSISEEHKNKLAKAQYKYCIAYNFITSKYIEADSRLELRDKLKAEGYSEINEQKIYDTLSNNSTHTGDYLIANSVEELQEKIKKFSIPKRNIIYLYNYRNPEGIHKFNSISDAETYINKYCKINSGHLSTAINKNNEYIKDFIFGLSESEINYKIQNFSPFIYFYNIEKKCILIFETIHEAVVYFKQLGINCNETSFSKAKLGKQKQASGFIIGRNKKELIERIAYYTKEEIQTVSDLIVNNELTNEQFAISWNDSLNEISVRF